MTQGASRIDFGVHIDWQGSPGIGADYHQAGGYDARQDQKAFYDTRSKLLASFPLALPEQKIFKDAPFDVLESKLGDTFFDKWSGIKNDIIHDWVDVYDPGKRIGVALLGDHTTSYAHGPNFPLGLTLQYSGVGLWGRNYSIKGPTDVSYALLPHADDWSQARLCQYASQWNEPPICQRIAAPAHRGDWTRSLMAVDNEAISVSSIRIENGSVVARFFNGSESAVETRVQYFGHAKQADRVELNGRLVKRLPIRSRNGASFFDLKMPRLGIATVRLSP